jgi:hypothetical protein
MIRQAHTYLAGAVSGTALIAAAVVGFVMLVSLQALRDWPLAGIGSGDSAAVSTGRPVGGAGNTVNAGARHAIAAGVAGKRAHGTGRQRGGANSLGGQHEVTAAGGSSPAPSRGESPSGSESPSSSSTGSAGSTPSSAPGGSGGGPGSGGGSGQSTSGAVTGAVNETVSGVDQATGGALGSTGVTKATEETVNGVAAPESPVGKTVDKVVETVGGLLGDGK